MVIIEKTELVATSSRCQRTKLIGQDPGEGGQLEHEEPRYNLIYRKRNPSLFETGGKVKLL